LRRSGRANLGTESDRATFRTLHTSSLASPALREGLTASSAERSLRHLRALLGTPAAALTDTSALLAWDGRGSHHGSISRVGNQAGLLHVRHDGSHHGGRPATSVTGSLRSVRHDRRVDDHRSVASLRHVVDRLAAAGADAVFSYAGRTEAPVAQPLPMRVGGFGGAEGNCRAGRETAAGRSCKAGSGRAESRTRRGTSTISTRAAGVARLPR